MKNSKMLFAALFALILTSAAADARFVSQVYHDIDIDTRIDRNHDIDRNTDRNHDIDRRVKKAKRVRYETIPHTFDRNRKKTGSLDHYNHKYLRGFYSPNSENKLRRELR